MDLQSQATTNTGRVLHIINNLRLGGAERFLTHLAAAQAASGRRLGVATLVDPNPLAVQLAPRGVAHFCMGRRRLNDARLVLDLRRVVRTFRPAVVHTHLFYADTFGRVAAHLAGVPVVVSTEHSTEAWALSKRRLAGMRWTARYADRIVAVSEAVRRSTAARLGIPESRIPVIHNGIDIHELEAAQALPRAEMGVPEDAILVGCVGRIVEAKGYDSLLRAVRLLDDPHVHAVIVGDGPLRADLEGLAARLSLSGRISWLGQRQDVPRILKALDVFLMPSRWEGHPLALLEAMAAGRAIVASDIPELVETVRNGAIIVPAGDVAALAAAIRRLADGPGERAALGKAARQAVAPYSIAQTCRAYLELYDALLRQGSRGDVT